jgi:hypothetical protein
MELFTPADQKFTLDQATMSVVRTGYWTFELSGTRLLLFQGDTGNTIDEYNPTTDTVTPKGSLDFHASSSTLLANGKVFVLGTDVSGLYNPDAVPPAPDFTQFDETSVPGSSVLPRSGQTATQLSGDKRIFVAGGKNAQNLFQGAALFNPARIWSDKDDYLPGDNVILSGSGWKPNENVYLYAVDDTTEAWTYGSTVAADANGGFIVDPLFVVQLVQLGAHFSVSAVGAQSAMQADVKFTDAGNFTYTPSTYTQTIADGASNNFLQNVTDPKNNDALTASPVVTGSGGTPLPTSWVTTSVPSLSFPASSSDQTQSWTVTVTVPSGTAAGTYTGNIKAHATAGGAHPQLPGDGQGTDLSITVPAHATTLSVSSASGTYGGTVNLTATLTLTSDGSPISGKTINFTLNGNPVGSAITDGSGVATKNNVSLCGINVAGSPYPSGVEASFAAVGIYGASSGTASLTVGKATATVVVTPYTVTYDGNAHTATVTSITGVCGETGGTVGTVSVSGTTHTSANNNVPYSDTWTFTPTANYNTITTGNTITDTINKATPTFSGLTASQTISCGTATISLSGKLSAGAGPTQVSPVGQMASITVDGAPLATSTGFVGNAGNFSATITTSTIPGGTWTITYHYGGDGINFNPATDDTSTTLMVNNCNQPPVAQCKNVTVSADANCQANASIDNGSYDPDSGDTIMLSQVPAGPYPFGDTLVTLTVTDSHGVTSSCMATVTVVDNTPPTVNCKNATVYLDASGNASITESDVVASKSDNCGTANITLSQSAFTCDNLGANTVTVTANDGHGNTASCTATVTVVDNTPPVITKCAKDQTITAACAPASTLVPDFTADVVASDNCGGVTVTQTPAAGTGVGVGNTTVTLHVSDTVGNETTCTATLSVHYDFSGFFQPVDNAPTYNRVKAGSAVPVKFSLGCYQGLNIMAVGYPASGPVACVAGEPTDDVEVTVTAGGSSLNYDATANQYIYVWKTDKAWAGSCRVLNVKLADGTSHYAYFTFFK